MKLHYAVALSICSTLVAFPVASQPKPKPKAVAPSRSSTPAKPLPVFDFRGSNTETISTIDQLDKSTCTETGDEIHCQDFKASVAGSPMRFLLEDFYKGKLNHVFASFGDGAYGNVLSAFTAKYGTPNDVQKRKWESKGGATFDNEVMIWNFKGGQLELDSMGMDVESGSFEFDSKENAAPAKPAKVDF